MANTIQVKRGANASLPTLAAGEFGFSTDTYQLHIGDGTNNHEIVMHDLFDANTILAATTDNTPVALTVAEQTVVGRLTSGNIAALTGADLWTILTGQAGADVSMNSHKLTSVADPTLAQDAATKTYVDSLVAHGLTFHEAVKEKDATYPISSATAWAASTSYAEGDLVEPTTANGYFYKCTTAGTSDSAEPTWGTTIGGTTADGTAVWTCYIKISTPTSGDRYWVGGTGEGDWSGHDYKIAQYNGTSWDFEAVTDGDAAYVTDENIVYFYDSDTTSLKELYTAIGDHAATHISGGSDEIDGDKLDIDWNPTNYTPSTSPAEADSADDLTAHLAGIDDYLGTVATTFTALTDTPASISALYVVRGNSAGDALEMVDFGTTYLEDTPTDGETGKAPTSNWAYDHNAATTGVHGAGTNTLLHSGSTIDGGSF